MTAFSAPRVLRKDERLDSFTSGVDVVDAWVRKRASRAAASGTAVAYISWLDGEPAGVYALSAHSVLRDDVQGGWLKRNAPEEIPAVLLGMLGVDKRFQGKGLGSSLLRDAILRAQHVSDEIGARALLVDPVDDNAAAFYRHFGFRELPGSTRMFLPLKKGR